MVAKWCVNAVVLRRFGSYTYQAISHPDHPLIRESIVSDLDSVSGMQCCWAFSDIERRWFAGCNVADQEVRAA